MRQLHASNWQEIRTFDVVAVSEISYIKCQKHDAVRQTLADTNRVDVRM